MAGERLNLLLEQLASSDASAAEAFLSADRAGVSLAQLLDVTIFDYDPGLHCDVNGAQVLSIDSWPSDWIEDLIQHLGGVAAAQEILASTARYRNLSVEDHLRTASVRSQLGRARELGMTVSEFVSLVKQLPESFDHWYHPMVTAFAVRELAAERSTPPGVWRYLSERSDQPSAVGLEVLLVLGPERACRPIGLLAGRAVQFDDPTTTLALLAGMFQSESRSLWDLWETGCSHIGVRECLAVFLRSGFGVHASVHAAVERCPTVVDAVHLLRELGVPDEGIYSGLVDQGIGSPGTLAALRDASWSIEELVGTLRREGALEPEIREALIGLGVGTEAATRFVAGSG